MTAQSEAVVNSGEEPARLYHSVPGVHYFIPNDAPEHARLNSQAFHLSVIMNHRVIHAPVSPNVTRILDVGCGTGIVTILLGKQFPEAVVYGLDLSPVPSLTEKPPNVRFLQGNVMKAFSGTGDEDDVANTLDDPEVTNLNGKFDYIFNRLLLCGMSDWPGYTSKILQLLKPGGYAEMHEVDYAFYDGNNNIMERDFEWLKVFKNVAKSKGLDLDCGSNIKTYMKNAGFEDIRTYEYRSPWGGEWEETPEYKAFGEHVVKEMPEVLHTAIAKNLDGKGYSDDQIKKWQSDMRHDTRPEPGKHWKFIVTVGRKPSASTQVTE